MSLGRVSHRTFKIMTAQQTVSPTTEFSRPVPKPWGHEVVFTPAWLPYVGKLLNVRGGMRLSLQLHDMKTESLALISGSARLALEDEHGSLRESLMEPGVGYTVFPGRAHRITALSDCVIVEASTPEVGTTVRIEDDFGRPDEVRSAG
jgi:mannose-6-phosphate isomerase